MQCYYRFTILSIIFAIHKHKRGSLSVQSRALRLLIVLLVLIAILPFGFSFLAQDNIESRLSHLKDSFYDVFGDYLDNNKELENYEVKLDLSLKDFERGWITSNANVVVNIQLLPKPPKDATQNTDDANKENTETISPILPNVEIKLPATIYHGPLLYIKKAEGQVRKFYIGQNALYSKVDLSTLGISLLQMLLNNEFNPQLELISVEGLTGRSRYFVQIKPFEFKGSDAQFNWKGYALNIDESSNSKKLDITSELMGITVALKKPHDLNLTVGPIRYTQQCDSSLYDFCLGNQQFSIDSIQFSDHTNKFELANVNLGGHTNLRGELVDVVTKLLVERVQVNTDDYKNGRLIIALKNIDAVGLRDINQHFKKLNIHSMKEEELIQYLVRYISRLVNKEIVFEIQEVNLDTPQGNVHLDALFRVQDYRQDQNEPLDVSQLLSKAHVGFVVSKALAEKFVEAIQVKLINKAENEKKANNSNDTAIPQDKIKELAQKDTQEVIAEALKEGYVVSEGDLYKMNLTYTRKEPLVINGKSMDLGKLKGNAQ